jgi:hypothetical protein
MARQVQGSCHASKFRGRGLQTVAGFDAGREISKRRNGAVKQRVIGHPISTGRPGTAHQIKVSRARCGLCEGVTSVAVDEPSRRGYCQPRVGFLFLGGAHQILHMAPVAAKLHASGRAEVIAFALRGDCAAVAAALERFGQPMQVVPLATPRAFFGLTRVFPGLANLKVTSLLASRRLFAGLDALVVAERTSSLLKRLPGTTPRMIHIPHGTGDRAKGFEQRIRLFDQVIVAGPKDRNRMIAEGLVDPGNCFVSGSIKRAAVRSLLPSCGKERLFESDRPVIFYNPHFDRGLSSWDKFADALISAVERSDNFNLVVAPHVRLRARLSAAERRRFEARARPDRVIVDFGSGRSCDMSYALAADLYVGDVSSQVYEFLDQPKPCLYFNSGCSDWRNDPNFAHWRLGEVVDDPADIEAALNRATACHSRFAELQRAAVAGAMGPEDSDAVQIAAGLIGDLVGA